MKQEHLESLNLVLSGFSYLSYSHKVCGEFLNYLERTSSSHIISRGHDTKDNEVSHDFGYPHRYTEKYIKGRFAKLYLLDDWYQDNQDVPITFLTMTAHHFADHSYSIVGNSYFEDLPVRDIHDTFKRLQRGKRAFLTELRHMGHKHVSYIMVVEPHDSGFPHYHFIVFDTFTIDEQIRLRNFYEKWGIGSFEHGLDFDERPKKNIKSLRNYLMKYMSKSFPDFESKFSNDVWTKEYLLFNAIAWKYGFKTWCASNDLSKIMSYKYGVSDNIEWDSVVLESPTGEYDLWKKKDDEFEVKT